MNVNGFLVVDGKATFCTRMIETVEEERVNNYYAAKHKAGFFINKLHQEGFQVFSNQRENITSLFMN